MKTSGKKRGLNRMIGSAPISISLRLSVQQIFQIVVDQPRTGFKKGVCPTKRSIRRLFSRHHFRLIDDPLEFFNSLQQFTWKRRRGQISVGRSLLGKGDCFSRQMWKRGQGHQSVIVNNQLLIDRFDLTAGDESQVQRAQPIPIEQDVFHQLPQLG